MFAEFLDTVDGEVVVCFLFPLPSLGLVRTVH